MGMGNEISYTKDPYSPGIKDKLLFPHKRCASTELNGIGFKLLSPIGQPE